jgi:hypothetical protein
VEEDRDDISVGSYFAKKKTDKGESYPWMKEDTTSREGGLPTLAGLYISTFQPSQRGFFRVHTRVHTCVWREREPEPEFSNFSGPQASIPRIGRLVSETLYLFATLALTTYAGGTDLWNAILISLNFGLWRTTPVCYVTLSFTSSGLNLCQIVKTVLKT